MRQHLNSLMILWHVDHSCILVGTMFSHSRKATNLLLLSVLWEVPSEQCRGGELNVVHCSVAHLSCASTHLHIYIQLREILLVKAKTHGEVSQVFWPKDIPIHRQASNTLQTNRVITHLTQGILLFI